MEKIKMTTPLVEMDGDEMTRILWKMIKRHLLEPFIDLNTEYYLKKKSQGKATQVSEMDGKFHLVLYEAANSRMLSHVLKDFHKYVQVARTMSVKSEDRAKKSIEEHKAILEAIKAKDEVLAEQLAHEHIMNVIKNLHIEDN